HYYSGESRNDFALWNPRRGCHNVAVGQRDSAPPTEKTNPNPHLVLVEAEQNTPSRICATLYEVVGWSGRPIPWVALANAR
ncbi:MAG: hypothetical protein J6C81_00735, partial [Muribaculaceae bacterium]|nr:hypothetical protein [Muribaculaceae bacterium]